MEILLVVIIFFILFIQNMSLRSKLDSIKERTLEMEFLLRSLFEKTNQVKKETETERETGREEVRVTERERVEEKPKLVITTFETIGSMEVEDLNRPEPDSFVAPNIEISVAPAAIEEEQELEEELGWFEKFKMNNPDLERFIGENLISKLGIAIFVLGIAFFVKYAIDKQWINEAARVGIGFLAGGIVLGFAHWLRAGFKPFSSVLVSGGIAIFYFTLTIGFQEYHLFSQSLCFGLMVLVTAFSVFISIKYNRQELAILSLIGGFATPLMVSTGEGNYIVLFTYLLILDTGMLVLAYYRNWNWVNLLAFGFTVILYLSWFLRAWQIPETFPYVGALLFATGFYVVFTISNLINQIKEKRPFHTFELSMVLSNTFLYFSCGIMVLQTFHPSLKGLFTLGLAGFNLIATYYVHRNYKIEKNLFFLLIGLTLTFITLAAPIQLKGNYITLFWAAETSLLLWLAQKSKLEIYRFSSLIIFGLGLVSLIMDWADLYAHREDMWVIMNPAFLGSIFVMTSYYLYRYLLIHEGDSVHTFYGIEYKNEKVIAFFSFLLVPLGYFTGMLELYYHLIKTFNLDCQVSALQLAYHFIFTSVLLFELKRREIKWFENIIVYGGICNLLIYLFMVNGSILREFNFLFGPENRYSIAYWAHYLSLIPFVFQMFWLYKSGKNVNSKYTAISFALFLTILSSTELLIQVKHFTIPAFIKESADIGQYLFYLKDINETIFKSGFPVLWGLLAFLFLSMGIRKGYRELRISALVLIGITVLKLFLFDIRNVSEGGKIAAFILLGLVLLVISFTYQKIKAIILDEVKPEEEKSNEE